MNSISVTINASDGQTCTVEVDSRLPYTILNCLLTQSQTTTETCHNQASGNIRYLATGRVWFSYGSRRQGHFDCQYRFSVCRFTDTLLIPGAINIESTITDEDGRSSFADSREHQQCL